MAADFLPRRDFEFQRWSSVFANAIESDPNSYGLSEPDVLNYRTLNDSFAAALRVATDPSMSTRSAVSSKNEKRRVLETEARRLARIVRATPTVSAEMRINLSLNVRDVGGRSAKIAAPSVAPSVLITSMFGPNVTVQVSDPTGASPRSKPRGVAGVSVFFAYGELAPADLMDWSLVASSGRTTVCFALPTDRAPGTKVWLAARYYNPRQEPGPISTPIFTHSQFGVGPIRAVAA